MRNLDREPDQEPGEGWKRGFRFHDIGTRIEGTGGETLSATFTITEQLAGGGESPRQVTLTVEEDGKDALDSVLRKVGEHNDLQNAFDNERTKDDADVWNLQTLRKALAASHAGLPESLQPTE